MPDTGIIEGVSRQEDTKMTITASWHHFGNCILFLDCQYTKRHLCCEGSSFTARQNPAYVQNQHEQRRVKVVTAPTPEGGQIDGSVTWVSVGKGGRSTRPGG